jgi:hypothetical protein
MKKKSRPKTPNKNKRPDWWDGNSGCYCVICLAQVKADIFDKHEGCCPRHKFEDRPLYR